MRKLTCDPKLETLGQNLVAFVDNLQGIETGPIMRKHGLVDINPTGWYPARMLLDALNEMAEKSNTSSNLTAIGLKIGEIVPFAGIENPTLEQALSLWNDIYQGLHRNADAGSIRCEKVSETHWKTIHSVIYPDDLSYGVLYGYGRRFLPKGTHFKVFYDENEKARDYGGTGETSIIHIAW